MTNQEPHLSRHGRLGGANSDVQRVVRIVGLSPKETVEVAETALAEGGLVQLQATSYPSVARALAIPIRAHSWIPLSTRVTDRRDALALRVRDMMVALLLAALSAPIIGCLALAVRLTSGPPAFFSAEVVGMNGARFRWRKIRSMRVPAPGSDIARRRQFERFVSGALVAPATTKIVDSQRVTRLGAYMRKHSLDELPQIWNVLQGHMTLVGPRPCLPYEYEVQADWQRLRFRAKPGLTGPWQAYGRSAVSFDDMALIDYSYTRSRNFWTDLRIIGRTVYVVVSGSGGH